jgi:hypothetical protein
LKEVLRITGFFSTTEGNVSRTSVALVVLGISLILNFSIWIFVLGVEGLFGTQTWIDLSYGPWRGPILIVAISAVGLLALAPLVFFFGRHDFSGKHPVLVTFGLVLIYVTMFVLAPASIYIPSWVYFAVSPLIFGFGILLLVWTPATKTSRSLLVVGALTMPIYIGYGILCIPVFTTLLSLGKTEQKRVTQREKEMEDWLTHVD